MGNPLEDEVIKFIASKRPLKLVFLAVAVVGVLGSAYKTLEPLIASAKPIAYRILNVSLDPASTERLGCAYFSGAAQWDLPRTIQIAKSVGSDAVLLDIRRYQNRLSQCMAFFGSAAPPGWAPMSTTPEEVSRAEQATSAALYAFSGAVQSKDRLSYLVFRLGADTAFAETKLAPESPDQRQMLELAPDPIELDLARRFTDSLDEARSACPCKFPSFQITGATRGTLLKSTREVDRGMTEFLRLTSF